MYLKHLDWQSPWCNKTQNRVIHACAQIRKFQPNNSIYYLTMNKYRDLTRTLKMFAERIESKTR